MSNKLSIAIVIFFLAILNNCARGGTETASAPDSSSSIATDTLIPATGTATPLPTWTHTPVPPSATATPLPTLADTSDEADTSAETNLPTNTPEPTPTPIPTNTPVPTDTPVPTNTPDPTPIPDWLTVTGRTEEGLLYLGNPQAPVRLIDYSDFM